MYVAFHLGRQNAGIRWEHTCTTSIPSSLLINIRSGRYYVRNHHQWHTYTLWFQNTQCFIQKYFRITRGHSYAAIRTSVPFRQNSLRTSGYYCRWLVKLPPPLKKNTLFKVIDNSVCCGTVFFSITGIVIDIETARCFLCRKWTFFRHGDYERFMRKVPLQLPVFSLYLQINNYNNTIHTWTKCTPHEAQINLKPLKLQL